MGDPYAQQPQYVQPGYAQPPPQGYAQPGYAQPVDPYASGMYNVFGIYYACAMARLNEAPNLASESRSAVRSLLLLSLVSFCQCFSIFPSNSRCSHSQPLSWTFASPFLFFWRIVSLSFSLLQVAMRNKQPPYSINSHHLWPCSSMSPLFILQVARRLADPIRSFPAERRCSTLSLLLPKRHHSNT